MKKTKEQLIRDFKKSNKERRQVIATNAGFDTPEEYIEHLEKGVKKTKVTVSKMKGVFYVVDILDATGSMNGGKYNNSVEGIIGGINDLKIRKDNIKYSLIEFIQASKPFNKIATNATPNTVNVTTGSFNGANGNDTPLYFAVFETINNMTVNKEDKVLINVYTDGYNNSKSEYRSMAAELIKRVQKENFTVTFVATPEDLKGIKRDLNVDDSNTLPTENTAQGFKMSMAATRGARTEYFAKSIAGEDTLIGFYKKGGKL